MTDTYATLANPVSARVTRARSRFIALAFPARSRAEVDAALARVKRTYHDATHRPFAFRLFAERELIERADDDGEPTGSAGRPILRELAQLDLFDVLAVVVRYFGGTKLGVGGLSRAYAEASRAAVGSAKLVLRERRVRLRITCPPGVLPAVLALVGRHGLTVERTDYREVLAAALPSRLPVFRAELQEETGARAQCEEIG